MAFLNFKFYDPFVYYLLGELKNTWIFRTYLPLLFLSLMLSRDSWFRASADDAFWLKKYAHFVFFFVFVGFSVCALLEIIKAVISSVIKTQKGLRKEELARLKFLKIIEEYLRLDTMCLFFQFRVGLFQLYEQATCSDNSENPEDEQAQQQCPSLESVPSELEVDQKGDSPTIESVPSTASTSTARHDLEDDLPKRELGPSYQFNPSRRLRANRKNSLNRPVPLVESTAAQLDPADDVSTCEQRVPPLHYVYPEVAQPKQAEDLPRRSSRLSRKQPSRIELSRQRRKKCD